VAPTSMTYAHPQRPSFHIVQVRKITMASKAIAVAKSTFFTDIVALRVGDYYPSHVTFSLRAERDS